MCIEAIHEHNPDIVQYGRLPALPHDQNHNGLTRQLLVYPHCTQQSQPDVWG